MPSFDVVSEVDEMEVKNAVEQTQKELAIRVDFRKHSGLCPLSTWFPKSI